MLLYKTKSFCNIGLSYKLLRSRIVDLTFRLFLKKCKFYDLRTRTRTRRFFSELGFLLGLVHQELGLELGLIEIFFAELGLVSWELALGLGLVIKAKFTTLT